MPWIAWMPALPPASTGDFAGSTATTSTPGTSCFRTSPHTRDAAARADACDKRIDLAARRFEDLARRCAAMDVGVGDVVELLRHEVRPVLVAEFLRGIDGAAHAFDRGRQHKLRAVAREEATALGAHVFGHREYELVALDGADHREADAGVAGCWLDDRVAACAEIRSHQAFTLDW